MSRTFFQEYRKDLAQQRDRIRHNLKVTRFNPINKETKEIIEFFDPNLNNEIVDRGLKEFIKQIK